MRHKDKTEYYQLSRGIFDLTYLAFVKEFSNLIKLNPLDCARHYLILGAKKG